MSETAQTLIKSALRLINAIATGETPTNAEMAEALEALQIMIRGWSNENVMIYSISQDTLTMSGAASYTIGSGGDLNTEWPIEIKGAVVDTIYNQKVIGESRYRMLKRSVLGSTSAYIYYNPVYPLGVLYPWPTGGSSMVIDSLKMLSDPATLTTDIEFPPPYDAAIKFNLAVELAPEYGKDPSAIVQIRAAETLKTIRSKNMAAQMNEAHPDIKQLTRPYRTNYNIDGDVTV